MKKILIVIRDMKIGGAQKSLLSFLQCLSNSPMGREAEIHLMVFCPRGPLLQQISDCVKLVDAPRELQWLSVPIDRELLRHISLRSMRGELRWLRERGNNTSQHIDQKKWNCWQSLVPENTVKYDVAISYIDGCPNYYVMDKVHADKKVLWVHSDYEKQGYDPEFDEPFFEKSDAIVTISEGCRQSLVTDFPHLEEKVHVLHNITDYEEILRKSKEEGLKFSEREGLKILTVGRLHPQKGIDIAVDAANLLKESGVSFQWLIVGEGAQRAALQNKIDEYGLSQYFQLIGSRENPYAYMAQCDMLVQPSRVEGKSIVLDEAKLLCKPIVATDYATVRDSIAHGENGWIVPMSAQGIYEGILYLQENPELCKQLIENLQSMPKGNEKELEQYVKIMF